MGWLLFLVFTLVPMAEIYLFIQVGGLLGPAMTVGLVLLTGMAGAMLARDQGLSVFAQWRSALEAGRPPEDGVVSGLLVLVGGVLLVTPGILTDVVGFSLLIPGLRRRLAARIQRWARERGLAVSPGEVFLRTGTSAGGEVIDAEVVSAEERSAP